MAYGICKLTGNSGKFVEAHIIPKALSRPSVPGEYFITGGKGNRPKKAWSSWYDKELVIQKGKNVLRDMILGQFVSFGGLNSFGVAGKTRLLYLSRHGLDPDQRVLSRAAAFHSHAGIRNTVQELIIRARLPARVRIPATGFVRPLGSLPATHGGDHPRCRSAPAMPTSRSAPERPSADRESVRHPGSDRSSEA